MKKLMGFFKKKEEGEQDLKTLPEDNDKDDLSTKDKDPNSDQASKEAKLEEIKRSMHERRVKKFNSLLEPGNSLIDIEKLRGLAWNGIPNHNPYYRATIWKLLLDYLPTDQEMWGETISRKREEYKDMALHYFGAIQYSSAVELKEGKEMNNYEKKSMKQVQIDVYRTQPEIKLFSSSHIQAMMIRILFVWSMRHPASGYVQGINDLAPPLVLAFLASYLQYPNESNIYEITEKDLEEISEQQMLEVEADVFWCLSKLIEDVQDNYTELQPGVQKILGKMKKLIENADQKAFDHLYEMDINFNDFAYRWVSCYLTREFNIYQIIRLWDTYFSEEDGFSQFHCYVNAALFLFFSKELKSLSFQDCMLFLQNLPTNTWSDEDVQMLLAKSYEMKQLYHYSTHQFQ